VKTSSIRAGAAFAVAAALAGAERAESATLKPETIAAWESYAELVEARFAAEVASDERFLPDHALEPDERDHCRAAIAAAGVCIVRRRERDRTAETPDIPSGMVHHWMGMIRIPGARLDDLVTWVQDYDRQTEYYDEVEASELLEQVGDRFEIRLRLVRKKVVTVHYETEHDVAYRRHDPDRVSSRSYATRIAELANAGDDDEREKAIGQDSGFLWRWHSYWRFRQVGSDVVVACESVSLSRGIPFGVRWLVGGMVNSIPRESLERTLTSMRDGFLGSIDSEHPSSARD